jgi:hypothetical protein
MHISLMSYTFHPMTHEGTMDAFTYPETVRYRYDLRTADLWNRTLASLDTDYLEAVRMALVERELDLVNLAVDGAHIWEDDANIRDEHHKVALDHLLAAELLGAKSVRIDAGGGRDERDWTPEQFDHIVMRYREYAERAHDKGYMVGPENHWGAAAVPEVLKRVCEAVDHPAFGVLLHCKRWFGDLAHQGDEIVAPWAMHLHLTAAMSDDELSDTMEMLRETGYAGVWGIELGGATHAEAGVMVARVRRVLEGWRLAAPER